MQPVNFKSRHAMDAGAKCNMNEKIQINEDGHRRFLSSWFPFAKLMSS